MNTALYIWVGGAFLLGVGTWKMVPPKKPAEFAAFVGLCALWPIFLAWVFLIEARR